jgi:hypothetical protein
MKIILHGLYPKHLFALLSLLVRFTSTADKTPKDTVIPLATFESIVEWAVKEERIFNFAKERHRRLTHEIKILEEYVTSNGSLLYSFRTSL